MTTSSAETDVRFMERCLELAKLARDSGATAVGSIIVRGGEIIGEGVEATRASLDPAAHAELDAIRAACRSVQSLDLSGCVLYSTVEPCLLCGYAVRATRVGRVVFGTSAGEVGAIGSPHTFLADSGFHTWGPPPSITGGVLAAETSALLTR